MRLEKHTNSLIDFSQPLSFVFNNKAYKGFKGDTLASALIANDVLYYARSFKYGRKRGIIGAGVEEPNALGFRWKLGVDIHLMLRQLKSCFMMA